MATARLMETWAHGLDVADALGVTRPATARLRSIAHIGVRTRDFAFAINGLAAAERAVPRRAARTRWQHLVVGTGRCGAARHRVRRGLLFSGRPSDGRWRELDIAADGDDAAALAADRAGFRRAAGRWSMSAQREESPAQSRSGGR